MSQQLSVGPSNSSSQLTAHTALSTFSSFRTLRYIAARVSWTCSCCRFLFSLKPNWEIATIIVIAGVSWSPPTSPSIPSNHPSILSAFTQSSALEMFPAAVPSLTTQPGSLLPGRFAGSCWNGATTCLRDQPCAGVWVRSLLRLLCESVYFSYYYPFPGHVLAVFGSRASAAR